MSNKPQTRPALCDRLTYVYRVFALDRSLIYVGISQQWRQRIDNHRKRADWWKHAAHIEISEYGNRSEAFAAESWAIRHEAPIMNLEEQRKHVPEIPPTPILAFGHRVRHWSLFGEDEIPPEELSA